MQERIQHRPACSAQQRRIPYNQTARLREVSREIGGYRIKAIHVAEADRSEPVTTIFLLHGMVDSSATWRHLLPALRGFSVWSFDMPWSGLDGPGWPAVMTAEEWWRAALDLCPETPTICVGHSFGAAVLLDWLASDDREARDVRRLVLVSPFYDSAMRNWTWNDIDRLARDVPTRLEEALRARFGAATPDADVLGHMTAKLAERIVPDGVLELVRFGLRSRRWQIGSLAMPVLLVVGEQETDARRPYGAGLENMLPDAELMVVQGCGHFCMHERPEWLVHRLRHWLNLTAASAGQPDEVTA